MGDAHQAGLPLVRGFPGSRVLAPRHTRDTNTELCDTSLIISIGLWQSASVHKVVAGFFPPEQTSWILASLWVLLL